MNRDFLFIEALRVDAVIGIYPHERLQPQPLLFDAEIGIDAKRAARSETIRATLDYTRVCQRISEVAIQGRYQLLEALAENVAESLHGEMNISWIRLRITKPNAAGAAQGIGIAIFREYH